MPYSSCGFFTNDDKIKWWSDRSAAFPKLSSLAMDILAAPASKAFVERIFSVAGDLSSGKKQNGSKPGKESFLEN